MVCPATAANIAYRNSRGWVMADPVGGGSAWLRVILPDVATNLGTDIRVNDLDAGRPPSAEVPVGAAEVVISVTNEGLSNLSGLTVALNGVDASCDVVVLTPGNGANLPSDH